MFVDEISLFTEKRMSFAVKVTDIGNIDMFKFLGVRKIETLEKTKRKIYLASLEEDPTVKKVLKVYKNTKKSYQEFLCEVGVLEKICHPNVMVYEIAMSFPKHNVIAMPYCELGALYNMIGKIGQRQIDHYLLQICSAVKYLHGQNIVHRDIKLDNILLDAEHHLYITDFDMSCTVEPGCLLVNKKVGTVPYMAPEMLQDPYGWYEGFKVTGLIERYVNSSSCARKEYLFYRSLL